MNILQHISRRSVITLTVTQFRYYQNLEKVYPKETVPNTSKNKIDKDTIDLLERLSLVDCVNKDDIKTLESAIDFADQIFEVDTTNVPPLVTVLEDYPLRVREDQVTEGNCSTDILRNASVTEDDYFVAPPGNIPLDSKDLFSKKTDSNMLQKILDMIVTNGFVKYINRENVKYLKLGPTGVLLQENLKTQWCNNVVMSKELTVFPSKGDIQDTFEYAKKLCLEKVPFGIAETIEPLLTETILKEKNNKSSSHPTNFGELFEDKDQVILKSTIFVPSETSTPFFHQWQRQRRIWWRKFSASPGRYSLTDIKNHGMNKQSVDIMAEYPWGTQLLETIDLSNKVDKIPVSKLQFKDSRKQIHAWVISSEVNLPTMFLNAICDAYDEPLFQEDKRQMLRLHRKLAPYRISFAVTGSSAAKVSELSELALYLSKQLRANYTSTLLLPSSAKHTLETQFKQYDQFGIPYTVILNDKTLVDGICQLRSRDTTLKEQVHVSSLVLYVEKLFKND